jgi:putative ABC transport system permease protein
VAIKRSRTAASAFGAVAADSGLPSRARVVAVHEIQAVQPTPSAEFVFNREALAGLPVVFYGGVRMQPAAVGALQRAVFDKLCAYSGKSPWRY